MINIFELLLTGNMLSQQNKQKLQNLINNISSRTDYLIVIGICTSLLSEKEKSVMTIPDSIDDMSSKMPAQVMLQFLNYLGANYFDMLLQYYNQMIDHYMNTQPENSLYKNRLLAYSLDIKNLDYVGKLSFQQQVQPLFSIQLNDENSQIDD